MLKCCNY